MLNILHGYIENSLPEEGCFETRPGLRAKVDESGSLLPFVGNTAVFLLDESTKQVLTPLQDRLYRHAGHLLADRLSPATFHMTLHDLANGTPGEDTARWMAQTEAAARAILADLKAAYPQPLHMRATWMFNMVNTSIVLGLEPADPESRAQLSALYVGLNRVVPLNYALTPHITLAYFKPGHYTQAELAPLREALTKVELALTLRMEDLVLQGFTDMNHYFNI